MEALRFFAAVFAGAILPLTLCAVELDTGGKSEAELNSEIVIRCQYQMGEFGSEAIDACVKDERKARELLADYPDEVADIVKRCNRVMRKAGWSMIKNCSDRDIAALEALREYPQQHTDAIEACFSELGRYGYDKVKRCADARIAEEGASE